MAENEPETAFQFSFDIKADLPYLASIPDTRLASIECHIVDVIYESFIVAGDQDYFAARLLAQKMFPRPFFWAASQTVEKYLKGFLLLQGISIAKASHNIRDLFGRALKLDPSLSSVSMEPHPDLKFDEGTKERLGVFSLDEFLVHLMKYGSPENRYNSFGADYSTGHLFALDALAYAVRNRMIVAPIEHSLRGADQEMVRIFLDHNPRFSGTVPPSADLAEGRYPLKRSMSSTKLNFLIKNKDRPEYAYALAWLETKMKLPLAAKPSK